MTKRPLILWRPISLPAIVPDFHLEPLERRYFLSAQLDSTFGDGGHVFAPTPQAIGYVFFTVQPDGRILLASSSLQGAYTGEFRTILQRLLPDGSIDPSFHASTDLNLEASQMRLQKDGKILLMDLGLVRLNPDGQLDPTFHFRPAADSNGSYQDEEDAAVLPDGRIVTIGTYYDQEHGSHEVITSYNPDGSPDLTFGQNGISAPLPNGIFAENVRVTPDGHILTLVNTDPLLQTSFPNFLGPPDELWQLNFDGSIDSTFGDAGHIVLPGSSWESNPELMPQDPLIVQSDGKIIVGVSHPWPQNADHETDDVVYETDELVRYLPSGAIDPTFANTGVAELPFDPWSADMLLQNDGKIVVVLDYENLPRGGKDPTALLRLNPDGTTDTTFGPDGIFPIDGVGQGDSPQALLQGDKIIILPEDAAESPDPESFVHLVRVEDIPASAAEDNPIPLPPTAKIATPRRWSEKPIFQDATDNLDWSQLEQPWD